MLTVNGLKERETELLNKLQSANTLEIARNNIKGYSGVNKFGENDDIDTGTAEDLIVQGGTLTFSTTADIDTLTSSDNADTQSITIEGLAAGFIPITQTVDLTGQTVKLLSTPLIRADRMFNSDNSNFAGDVYISINGASITAGVPQTASQIRNKIKAGDNQTLMGVFTIPAGKTGYLENYHVSMAKLSPATAIVCSIRTREFEGVFRVKDRGSTATTGATHYERDFKTPIELLEKTDIKIVIDSVTANNTAVSGGFDIILVNN